MGYAHVINEYLKELFSGPNPSLESIGVDVKGKGYYMRFFKGGLLITKEGIVWDNGLKAPDTVSIVALKYLLYSAKRDAKLYKDWVSFKDINGSGPFVGAFRQNVELPIETSFERKLPILKSACKRLGGVELDVPNYDLSFEFLALPMIRLRLFYNDRDETFPPKAVLLFDGKVEKYLDVECIAALGWIFADFLLEDIKTSNSFVI